MTKMTNTYHKSEPTNICGQCGNECGFYLKHVSESSEYWGHAGHIYRNLMVSTCCDSEFMQENNEEVQLTIID